MSRLPTTHTTSLTINLLNHRQYVHSNSFVFRSFVFSPLLVFSVNSCTRAYSLAQRRLLFSKKRTHGRECSLHRPASHPQRTTWCGVQQRPNARLLDFQHSSAISTRLLKRCTLLSIQIDTHIRRRTLHSPKCGMRTLLGQHRTRRR